MNLAKFAVRMVGTVKSSAQENERCPHGEKSGTRSNVTDVDMTMSIVNNPLDDAPPPPPPPPAPRKILDDFTAMCEARKNEDVRFMGAGALAMSLRDLIPR